MGQNQQANIKKFDRQAIAVLNLEIQMALDALKNKYGLSELNLGAITFTEFSFHSRITGKIEGEITNLYKDYQARYFASLNGLPENLVSMNFISNGRSYTIIGIETRNRKYPVITQCANDGKAYKFTVEDIKVILERTQGPHSQQLKILR